MVYQNIANPSSWGRLPNIHMYAWCMLIGAEDVDRGEGQEPGGGSREVRGCAPRGQGGHAGDAAGGNGEAVREVLA